MEKLGTIIKDARKQAGYSLRALAKKVGTSPTNLSFLENNRLRSGPSTNLIYKLAKALDFDPWDLFAAARKYPAKEVITRYNNMIVSIKKAIEYCNQGDQDRAIEILNTAIKDNDILLPKEVCFAR